MNVTLDNLSQEEAVGRVLARNTHQWRIGHYTIRYKIVRYTKVKNSRSVFLARPGKSDRQIRTDEDGVVLERLDNNSPKTEPAGTQIWRAMRALSYMGREYRLEPRRARTNYEVSSDGEVTVLDASG